MALNIILCALTAIGALNLILVCDLYARSARLAAAAQRIHEINLAVARHVKALTAGNPTE